MKSEIEKHSQSSVQQKETPLRIKCLRPVDPLNYYCPHCGEATGQLTPYIPFEHSLADGHLGADVAATMVP